MDTFTLFTNIAITFIFLVLFMAIGIVLYQNRRK